MKTNKKIAIALSFAPLASVFSQEIKTEVISVEKDYKPNVEIVERGRLSPEPEPEQKKKQLEYNTLAVEPRFSFVPKEIPALALVNNTVMEKNSQNYADFAFGSQFSGFADIFYRAKGKRNSFTADIDFNNMFKKIEGWDKKALFMRGAVGLTYAHRFANYTANVSVNGAYNVDTYTGLPQPEPPVFDMPDLSLFTVDTIARKRAAILGASAELVSDYKYKTFDRAALAYKYYNNNMGVSENHAKMTAAIKVPFSGLVFSVDGRFDYTNSVTPSVASGGMSGNEVKSQTFYTDVLPALSYKTGKIDVSLGADFTLFSRFNDFTDWFISPKVSVDYAVVPGIFNMYLGYSGGLSQLSVADLNEINPYISPESLANNNKMTNQVNFGLRGFVSTKLYYNVELDYRHYSKAVVFRLSQNPLGIEETYICRNSFQTFHEEQDITSLSAQLSYKPTGNLNFNLFGRYNLTWGGTTGKALHVPSYYAGLVFNGYFLNEKLQTSARLIWVDGSQALIKTAARADYYARVGYKLLPYMSVFVRSDNMIAGKTYDYPMHPQFGFKILGGVGFEF